MHTPRPITARVTVVRSGIGFAEFDVAGSTPEEVRGAALNAAANHSYSEKSSEYAVAEALDATGNAVRGVADHDRHGPAAQRLAAEFASLGLDTESLDGLVHTLASIAASSINNGGPETQIAYLLENGVSEGEIRDSAEGRK